MTRGIAWVEEEHASNHVWIVVLTVPNPPLFGRKYDWWSQAADLEIVGHCQCLSMFILSKHMNKLEHPYGIYIIYSWNLRSCKIAHWWFTHSMQFSIILPLLCQIARGHTTIHHPTKVCSLFCCSSFPHLRGVLKNWATPAIGVPPWRPGTPHVDSMKVMDTTWTP